MTARSMLLDAVNALEAAFAEAATLEGDGFEEHRKEVVRLRRQIAAQNATIATLCDAAFEQPERRQAFHSEFSKMRSAMAFHQASWPAVAIDFQNPGYLSSLQSMRDAHRTFIAWSKIALAKS